MKLMIEIDLDLIEHADRSVDSEVADILVGLSRRIGNDDIGIETVNCDVLYSARKPVGEVWLAEGGS
jgi:hypothetical protein